MNRDVTQAMWNGFNLKCPSCGQGALMQSYVKPVLACATCGEDLSHQQADDAPPYFTIIIVGHVVIPAVLLVEELWSPPIWLDFAIWLPLIALLSLLLLPRIKGAIIGLQWAMRLHGFSSTSPS